MTPSGELWAWNLSDGLQNLEGQVPNHIETYIEEMQIIVASEGLVVAAHHASDSHELYDLGHQSSPIT